jgi:hypothetical protein
VPGDKQLVAYVVASGAVPGNEELRAHLRSTLPEHAVPAVFVFLQEMPLSPNGKLDRKALPPPDASSLQKRPYVAPRNETEVALHEIWCAVLKLQNVGVHDNFFEIGGHSLHVPTIASRIEVRMNRKVPLVALFTYPTIIAMAQYLSDAIESPIDRQHALKKGTERRLGLRQARQVARNAGNDRPSTIPGQRLE